MFFILQERVQINDGNIGYSGIRGYHTYADRARAIKALLRLGKANRFICFKDVKSNYALFYMVTKHNRCEIL